MIKAVFLLPERDNDGQSFPQSAWDRVEERLVRLGRGYTVAYGQKGVWQAGGRRYTDVNNAYTVLLRSWEQLGAWLDVVRWARAEFRQEAIYVEVAGLPEVLRAPRPRRPRQI